MPNIDERVVQMTFDNKQFEQGVSESLKTIEDLKRALNFDKSAESLKNIETAVNKLDLTGLTNHVEAIGDKFSALGILGVTAMQRISDAAIDAGKNIFNTVSGIGNIKAGESKYQTRTKSVQTIMNATGKSLEEVERVLDRLTKYTDETSYDFSEMVSSIGKFTSVGVDLSVAERAMEGITNAAALAGASKQEANRAMYNFAQALSTGHVKLIDWKSIENANMSTKEFKEELIKTAIELGTIKKTSETSGKIVSTNQTKLAAAQKALKKAQNLTGKAAVNRAEKIKEAEQRISDATKEVTVDYKSFNETLTDGWLTSDVLIKTLNRIADTSTDIGAKAFEAAKQYLTLGDVMDTIRDAVSSSWMRTFQSLFGNLEEASALWTKVGDSILDLIFVFADYRESLIKSWHELGGYDSAIEAASDIWHTFYDIVITVKEAFEEIFPPITAERLVDITNNIRDVASSIREIFNEDTKYDAIGREIENSSIALESIRNIVRGFASAVDIIRRSIGSIGKIIGGVIKMFEPLGETGFRFIMMFSDMVQNFADDLKNEDAYGKFSEKVLKTLGPVGDAIKNISGAINEFIDSYAIFLKDSNKRNSFENFFGFLTSYLKEKTPFGPVIEFMESIPNRYEKIKARISSVTTWIGEKIGGLSETVSDFLAPWKGVKSFDDVLFMIEMSLRKIPLLMNLFGPDGNTLIRLKNNVIDFISSIGNSIRNAKIKSIPDLIKAIVEGFKKTNVYKSIVGFIDNAKKAFENAFPTISKFIKEKWTTIGKYFSQIRGMNLKEIVSKVIGDAIDWIKEKLSNAKDAIGDFVDEIRSKWETFKESNPIIENFINLINPLIKRLQNFISLIGNGFNGFFSSDTSRSGNLLEDLKNRLQSFDPVVEWFVGLKDKIIGAWNDLTSFFNSNGTSTSEGSGFVSVLDKIKEFFGWIKDNLGGIAIAAVGGFAVYWLFNTIKAITNFSKGFENFANAILLKNGGKKQEGLSETIQTIAESILMITAAIGLLSIIDANKAAKGIELFAITLGSLVGAMILLKGANKLLGNGGEDVGRQALMLAGSIGVIALSLLLMTEIVKANLNDPRAMIVAVGLIGGMLLTLAGIEAGLALIASKNVMGNATANVSGVLQMCLGLGVIVLAFGHMVSIVNKNAGNESAIWAAFGIIEVLLVTLGGIEGLMSAMASKSPKGIIQSKVSGMVFLAGALWIIVDAFGRMTNIISSNSSAAETAFTYIEGLLITLGAIAIMVGKFGGGILGGIGSGISVIASAFAIEKIVTAFGDVISKIKGTNVDLISKFFEGIEITIGIISTIVIGFGALPLQTFLGSFGLVAVMTAIGAGISIIAEAGSSAINKFANSIKIVGYCLNQFNEYTKDLDFDHLSKVGDFIKDTLPEMILNIILLNAEDANNNMNKIQSIGSYLYTYSKFISSITDAALDGSENAKTLMEDAKEISEKIDEVEISENTRNGMIMYLSATIFGYSELLKGIDITSSANAFALLEDAKAIAQKIKDIPFDDDARNILDSLGTTLGLYYGELNKIVVDENGNTQIPTVDSGMIQQAFEEMAKAIPTDTIDDIASYANGEGTSMYDVSHGIEALGTALESYATNIGTLNPTEVGTANSVLETFAKVNSSLKEIEIETIFGKFKLKNGSIGGLANDIIIIGSALRIYGLFIGSINKQNVKNANAIINKMVELKTKLTNPGSIFEFLASIVKNKPSEITQFGNDIQQLGSNLGEYANAISVINPLKIIQANWVLDKLFELDSKMPTDTGFFQKLWSGSKEDLSTFGTNIALLGDGLADYANAVSGANFNNTEDGLKVLTALADAGSKLGRSGGLEGLLSGDVSIASLGNGLGDFGGEIATFGTNVKDFKYSDVEGALNAIDKFIDQALALKDSTTYVNGVEYGAFKFMSNNLKEALQEIATIKDIQSNDGVSILDVVKEIGKSLITSMASGISENENNQNGNPIVNAIKEVIGKIGTSTDISESVSGLSMVGKDIIGSIGNGVESEDKVEECKNAIGTTISKLSNKIREYYDNFMADGKYIIDGLIAGLNNTEKINALIKAGAGVADLLEATFTGKLKIKSPSREFEWIGWMCALGLKNGLNEYSYLVSDAAMDIASSSLDTIIAAYDTNKFEDVGKGALASVQKLFLDNKVNTADLQKMLNLFGYLSEADITGKKNSAQVNAVKKFKKEVLGLDGVLDGIWRKSDSNKLFSVISNQLKKNGAYTEAMQIDELLKLEQKQSSRTGSIIAKTVDDSVTKQDEYKKSIEETTKALEEQNEALKDQDGFNLSPWMTNLWNSFKGKKKSKNDDDDVSYNPNPKNVDEWIKALRNAEIWNPLDGKVDKTITFDGVIYNYKFDENGYGLFTKTDEKTGRLMAKQKLNQNDKIFNTKEGNELRYQRKLKWMEEHKNDEFKDVKDAAGNVFKITYGDWLKWTKENNRDIIYGLPLQDAEDAEKSADKLKESNNKIAETANETESNVDTITKALGDIISKYTNIEGLNISKLLDIDTLKSLGTLDSVDYSNILNIDQLKSIADKAGIPVETLKTTIVNGLSSITQNNFDLSNLLSLDQLKELANKAGVPVEDLKNTLTTELLSAINNGFDGNIFDNIDGVINDKFGVHLPEELKADAGFMMEGLGEAIKGGQNLFTDALSGVSSAGQSAMMEDNGIASPSTVYHWFGEMMIEGLANGLSEGSWKVTEMAKKVASDALMAAKKELGIASPSDEFIWIGRMICDGFSLGLDNYSAIVGQSASELASNAIDVARMGIQGLSDTIKTDPDIIPTIRPVLDLNDLKASTMGVNSFYKDQAMAMKSLSMARGIAAKEQMRNIAEPVKANDSGKLMETINKLGERIDKLGEDFANTQIYLDGNTMVGYFTPRIDKSLGARAILARRMN